jgi:hypothetical protein
VSLHRIELPRHEHRFIGTWHIYSMELWDKSYFNMEVQAFIQVRPENPDSFQFGLVSGGLDGSLEHTGPKQRFVFLGGERRDGSGTWQWLAAAEGRE